MPENRRVKLNIWNCWIFFHGECVLIVINLKAYLKDQTGKMLLMNIEVYRCFTEN
jgi:hypothetical protein